jgi:hypothetical protein
MVWIALGLFAALVIGILFASLFLTIFYSASRLATAAERADSESAKTPSRKGANRERTF